MPTPPKPKPLTLRYALILLLALITAVTTGVLLYLSIHSTALSILTAGGALAASWRFYDDIIA
jgi:hypothetical protein